MNKESTDRGGERKRSRVNISLQVRISCSLGAQATIQSENISLKGMRCVPNPGLQPDELCDVEVFLDKNTRIQVQSKVVRAQASSVAFDFIKMDEESFHHLLNLVKLNAQDPECIETELRFPAFIPSD